jgi:hypothetical protein
MVTVLLVIAVLAVLAGADAVRHIVHVRRVRRQLMDDIRHELMMDIGDRCNKCGERYVGLALDCRCTNYGLRTK